MRTTVITAVAATAALAAVAASVPAQATGTHHQQPRGIAIYPVIARHLHNPRQLAFGPHGVLYVAEAGKGGNGACMPNPEGSGTVCFGFSGSVTRVSHGKQHRVLTGLPSIGDQGTGDSSVGPADLAVTGKHSIVLSLGMGTAPKNRTMFPTKAQKELAHLLSFNLKTKKATDVGDLAAHEAKANPVDNRDTDPTGVAKAGQAGFAVTDSGGNTLVTAKDGKVKSFAAFQDRNVPPAKRGTVVSTYQSVPTDVVKGPDGAWYVSELTGFPFIQGQARIWRVVPGHKPHVYADGLTNLTSLAFDGTKLYAVQLTDTGLLNGPPGSLVRVFPKSSGKAPKIVADGLFFPYGVAIHHGAAYVSTGSTDPGEGEVIKIPLS